ncbi:hypothetical protein FHS96_003736 [Sphingomonas zeicaulis]|uniref:DUF1660 family phage protein n=1 Tax=Sphingomonas zeicaulis TaxID=1632740 RepID=UPI003D1AA630
MSLRCRIFGHDADRGGARHDDQDYWTRCRRCGTELIRDIDGWRKPTERETLDQAFHLAAQEASRVNREPRRL